MAATTKRLPDLTPGGRLARLKVRDRVPAELARAVVTGTVTLSMSEVSTIALTIADPDLVVLASGLFRKGVPITYGRLDPFVVTTRTVSDQGVPTLEIEAMDAGAQRARHTRGELVRRDLSPSTYVQIGARQAGLRSMVQPSPKRRHITRKGPTKGQPAEDEYSVWQRLADELGFVCFVSAGVVYFAQPTWLLKHLPVRDVDWRHDDRVLGLPTATETANDQTQPATVDLAVTDSLAELLIPGFGANVMHLPTFNGTYLVTETQIPLVDAANCTVNTATPVNPKPQPVGGAGSGPGSATAAKFVTAALGEVGHGDPDPADVNPAAPAHTHPSPIDGGELIAWAAEQAGATVNTTPAGIWSQSNAKGLTLSLEAGRRLRGAILFASGRAAISLGDGRAIAAVDNRYRIVSASSSGWTAAAKLVGVRY